MFCGQSAEEGSHEEFEACGNEIDKFPTPWTLSLEQFPRFPCGPDKRPLVAAGFKVATTDPAQIAVWRAQFPNCLWGVPTGAVSGIDVLDIDPEGLGWYVGDRHSNPLPCFLSTHMSELH